MISTYLFIWLSFILLLISDMENELGAFIVIKL